MEKVRPPEGDHGLLDISKKESLSLPGKWNRISDSAFIEKTKQLQKENQSLFEFIAGICMGREEISSREKGDTSHLAMLMRSALFTYDIFHPFLDRGDTEEVIKKYKEGLLRANRLGKTLPGLLLEVIDLSAPNFSSAMRKIGSKIEENLQEDFADGFLNIWGLVLTSQTKGNQESFLIAS